MCHHSIIDNLKASLNRKIHKPIWTKNSSSQLKQAIKSPISFNQVVDLTHLITPDFPTFFGAPAFEFENELSYTKDKVNLRRLSFLEHVGTHFDAPIHFSENGLSIDEIVVERLVCPLAIIDIRTQACADSDYCLTVEDIIGYESTYGDIPAGACVAMLSGWEKHLGSAKYRGEDNNGIMHFPGFHQEAADYLLNERNVNGIAVDTLSLDKGSSTDSPVHYTWLPSGRWGIENIANLANLPRLGTTLIAGAPKFKGGTGGPGRIFALI